MKARSDRALLFRLPGHESATNAYRLALTAAKAGLLVYLSPYWPDGETIWPDETPLLEVDISSAPRLSLFAFEQLHGFQLDWAELSAHLFATEQLTPDLLLPETVWRQRLRGVASIAITLIRESGADIIFVPHGAEIISRILAQVASILNRRVLFWESGFFPEYLYLDPQAPHFFRGAARIDLHPLPKEPPTDQAQAFRETWRNQRCSKYVQETSGEAELARWLADDSRPILFLPGQVATDANAVVGLRTFNTLDDLYRAAIAATPPNWRILYKPHPLETGSSLADIQVGDDRFLSLNIDIHDAIETCDAVLTHSSNVGLEALLIGKPVLCLGRPIYSSKGLTIDLDHPRDLTRVLEAGTPSTPQDNAVLSLLDQVLSEALIADGDVETLKQRIAQSGAGFPQASRLPWYSVTVNALAQAAWSLEAALRIRGRLDMALDALPPRHFATLASHLDLEALKDYRFGGPSTPRSSYAPRPAPDLDPILGLSAAYSDLRLENLIDPVRALQDILEQHADEVLVLQVHVSDDGAHNTIQNFDLAAVREMAALAGYAELNIVGQEDGRLRTPECATQLVLIFGSLPAGAQHGLSEATEFRYRDWRIPADALEAPLGRRISRGIEISTASTHGLYGPFIHVPPGDWMLHWRIRPQRLSNVWAFFYNILLMRPHNHHSELKIEWVEHRQDAAHTITRPAFGKQSISFRGSRNAIYEIRTSWPAKRSHPSRALACFEYFYLTHVQSTDANLEDHASRPIRQTHAP